MTLRFDLVDLSLFRHVVEAGSITGGAERANLALAAASTRIRAIERSLGAPLLVRSRAGVRPTAAGNTLLAHARTLLTQAERLREDVGVYAGGAASEIRILSNTNALVEFLPEVLGQFLVAHPTISVDIQERLSDEIVHLVAEGAAEVGFVAATVETGSLETFPFRQDRFVVVVASGDPSLSHLEEIAFADVLGRDFVGLDRTSAIQRFLSGRAAWLGRSLRLRVQLRSFDGVCRLVAAGVGVGIVPETTARRAARTSDLHLVALTDPWAVRDLTLCLRDYPSLPASARLFVDHVTTEPGRPPAQRGISAQ